MSATNDCLWHLCTEANYVQFSRDEASLREIYRDSGAVEQLWGAKWLSMGFVVDNHRLWPLCYDWH
jgi:hypothetical protein